MALNLERLPLFLPGIRRKLTDSMIIMALVPLLIIELFLLLILIGINPNTWRQPSHPVRGIDDRSSQTAK
jgi:hypothetical protein